MRRKEIPHRNIKLQALLAAEESLQVELLECSITGGYSNGDQILLVNK